MGSDTRTYFIRHSPGLGIDDDTLERLWDQRRIAIHFPSDKEGRLQEVDNASLDPNDYSGAGKRATRTLVELARNGGYVCAEYRSHDECLIGYVEPESKIQFIKGTWGDATEFSGREAILKTLLLKRVKKVDPNNQPILLAGRPRQGTISRWHRIGETVANLVEGVSKSELDLTDLTPDQQETLCSEYLRLPEAVSAGLPQLAYLLLPVGRTLEDIDILGVSVAGDKEIIAQVTLLERGDAQTERKLANLRKYRGQNHLVMFCRTDTDTVQEEDDVLIFSIERVFSEFVQTDTGKEWLMHSLPSLE